MSPDRPTPAVIVDGIIAEPFAWPGGYEKWAVTDDGGQLCHRCCAAEREQIAESSPGDGWHVVAVLAACDVDDNGTCDHCGRSLPED